MHTHYKNPIASLETDNNNMPTAIALAPAPGQSLHRHASSQRSSVRGRYHRAMARLSAALTGMQAENTEAPMPIPIPKEITVTVNDLSGSCREIEIVEKTETVDSLIAKALAMALPTSVSVELHLSDGTLVVAYPKKAALTDDTIRDAVSNLRKGEESKLAVLREFGMIALWDVSKVTNMSNLFKGREQFNQDLSRWNVSNVVDMRSMFEGATNFNQYLSTWDVSKVISMKSMFEGATEFNQVLSGWNVSNVVEMKSMFEDATAFKQDLSSWEPESLYPFSDDGTLEDIFKHSGMVSRNLPWWVQQSRLEEKYGVIDDQEIYDHAKSRLELLQPLVEPG